MLSSSTQLIRLSQGQLKVLEVCPRQFQHTYLEQLFSPLEPDNEARLTLGSRFHLLMQQREIGLPIDEFVEADSQLKAWMKAFANDAPEILTGNTNSQSFRDSEHYRTLQVQDYVLTAIYDLLIADEQQAQIVDWKTYRKPPTKRSLESNWQTRLYLYILAETSDYLPENISMIYWFFQPEDKLQKPEGKLQSIKIDYNTVRHEQTAKKLTRLLSRLGRFLEKYQQGESFPQIPEGRKACEGCQYATRCGRDCVNETEELKALDTTLANLATIEEVSL